MKNKPTSINYTEIENPNGLESCQTLNTASCGSCFATEHSGSCSDVASIRVTGAKAERSDVLTLREGHVVLELVCNCLEPGDVGQPEPIRSPSPALLTHFRTNQIASGHRSTLGLSFWDINERLLRSNGLRRSGGSGSTRWCFGLDQRRRRPPW